MRTPEPGQVRVVADLPAGRISFDADDEAQAWAKLARLAPTVPAGAVWTAGPAGPWR